MRTYAVYFLLCHLFGSTAAVTPCDISLISENKTESYTPFEIHYDNVTNTLQCINEHLWNDFIPMIRFESNTYNSIKCTKDGGWIGQKTIVDETGKISMNESKLVDATSSLSIACKKACIIEKQDDLDFDKTTRTVTCNGSENSLHALREFSMRETEDLHTSLRCDDIKSRWMSGKEIFSYRHRLDNVHCRDYCEWTGDDLKAVKFDKGSGKHHVTIACADSSLNLYYAGARIEKEAKCSLEGWSSSNVTLLMKHQNSKYGSLYETPPHFECRKEPPACAFELSTGKKNVFEELTFEYERKQGNEEFLKCIRTNNTLKAIAFNSQHYERLQCDKEKGWTSNVKGVETKIAEAASPLIISCVEYCAVAGPKISVKVEKAYRGYLEIEATCEHAGVYENIVHNGEKLGGKYDTVTCSLSNGWKKSDYPYTMNSTKFKTLNLECKPNPCSYLDNGASGVRNGQPLQCREHFTAIEFKSKRYTSLTCDEVEGWKDGNTTIAEPSIPLDYKCVPYCRASGNAQIHADGKVNVVSCDDSANELMHARKHLVENRVECSFDKGWSFIKGSVNTEQQDFECRQAPLPCSFEEKSMDLLKSKFDHQTNKTILSCENANNTRQEIEFLSNRYASLECDETNGWKAGNKTIANAVSRMIVKCVSAENNPKKARKM